MENRTLDDRIGQLFCCGWQAGSPEEGQPDWEHLHALTDELRVGGLILFSRNLGTPFEVAARVAEAWDRADHPLLIGIDQEGGAVARFTMPGITFPGNMALGAARSPDLTRRAARATGEQLAAMGINVNFAPVLDVNNNPANPIIGTRSFGEDAALVAEHGLAALRGYTDAGVVPVVKHFPGHGDTAVDSHLDLPVQPASRKRLEAVELAPFRAAVEAGTPAIMTTHIMFPALDPELPATLSRRILNDLLRCDWGFEGVVVTDCLEMRGIADYWGPEEAAVLALEAGADLLLVCHTLDTQRHMIAAVRNAVKSGRIPRRHVDASLERLAALRRSYRLAERRTLDPGSVGAERYRALELEVARRALTILDDRDVPALPVDRPVLVAGAAGAAASLVASLRERGVAGARAVTRPAPGDDPVVVLLEQRASGEVGGFRGIASLAACPTLIAVALREPYVLAEVPATATRIAAYSDRPCALEAVADLLTGGAQATGRLPVTLKGRQLPTT